MATALLDSRRQVRPALSHARTAALALAGACLVAGLVWTMSVVPALALIVLVGTGILFLFRPHLATVVTVILLYVNFPAILTKQHGMPPIVAGAFILLLGFPILHAVVLDRKPLRLDLTFLLMLLYLAALLLSSLGAVSQVIARKAIVGYATEGLLLYILLVNAIRSLPDLRRVLWGVVAAGSVLGALCLYQTASGNYDQEFGGLAYRHYAAGVARTVDDDPEGVAARASRDRHRAQGPVNQANRFAQVMVVLLPFAFYLYRTGRSPVSRLMAAGAAALVLTGVALTLSRGAFVTLALLVPAMVLVGWVRASRAAIACAVLWLLVIPAVIPSFWDRMATIANARYLVGGQASSYDAADAAIRGRVTMMLGAFYAFLDHPVLGVGPGQFPPFYSLAYGNRTESNFRDLRYGMRGHSLYLELAAELGFVGLALFLAIVGLLLRRLWRARREWLAWDAGRSDLATALWLSLVTYLVMGVTEHLAYQRYYWFLIAAASAGLHVVRSRNATAAAAGARGVMRTFDASVGHQP